MALEFDEQLSRLEKPNRNEMTNKEYAVFNENVETMEKNWGFINNLFKVLPLNASQYIGFLDFKGSLFNPDTCYLTNADKEMIGVVVSSINCCSYCLTKDLLTEKQYALCEYAWYVTKHADEIDETQIENLRKAGFNDHEILEAAFVAGFFNYTNRWVSTIAPVANPGHFSHNRNFEG